MTMGEDNAIDARNLRRLESSTGLSGGWLKDYDNEVANYRESLGLGHGQMACNDGYQKGYPQFESMRTSTSFGGGGFVSPSQT